MHDWLRSIGQALGGIGLLSVAFTYWAESVKAESNRISEQRGLLMPIATEVRVNQQSLDFMSREPQRLLGGLEDVLQTTAWDRHGVKVAQVLSTQPLLPSIESYYENLLLLRGVMRYGVAGGEELEELRRQAEIISQQSLETSGQIYLYISSLQAADSGK